MPFSEPRERKNEGQKKAKGALTSSFFRVAERYNYFRERERKLFSKLKKYISSPNHEYVELAAMIKAIYEDVKSNPGLWKNIKNRILEAMLFFLRRKRIKIGLSEETKEAVRSRIFFFVEKLKDYLNRKGNKDSKALHYLLSEFYGSFQEDFLGSKNLRFVNFDLGWVLYYNLEIFLDYIDEEPTESLRVTEGIYFPQHKKFFVFFDSPTLLLHEYMHLLLYTMFENYNKEDILNKVYLPFMKYLKQEVPDLATLIPERVGWLFLNEFITEYLTYILYHRGNDKILFRIPRKIGSYYFARLFASKTAKDADRHLEHFFDLCANLS